jgi:hypothetical protein
MLGKYSPTIHAAYDANQNWYEYYAGVDEYGGENQYDPEGFDFYGYNKEGFDREGHHEDQYAFSGKICPCCGNNSKDNETLYHNTSILWGFDGVKPVRREK